jgi:MFS family permease
MGKKKWRKTRPLWGSLITIISGLMILWVPTNLYLSAFLPGSMAVIGLLFGGLITLIGILALFFPNSSKLLGIFTIFLSVLSVIGALGGFLFGTLFGIIGGSLMIAWRLAPTAESVPEKQPSAKISKTTAHTG